MAGARIIFPNFRDEQSDSKYPFADSATLETAGDALKFPRNGFIDAALYAIAGRERAYLSGVTVSRSAVSIFVGDEENTNVASAAYAPLSAPESGQLYLQDTYGRPAGMLIATKECLALLAGWPVGPHVFDIEATEFVSSVVFPAREPCVRAIQSDDELNFLTGDVWFIGDAGVVVRQVEEDVIKIDVVGEPLFKRLLCEGTAEDYSPGPYLQTINGCGPDEYGNFNITVVGQETPDTLLRIYPENNQLRIGLVGKKVI